MPERSIVLGENRSKREPLAFAPIPLCCGVLGGKNYDFFYEYADTSIKMVEDAENEPYWLNSEISKKNWGTKAIVAEQFYLACCLKHHRIKPELMFEKNYLIDYCPLKFDEEGFDHAINEKKDYFIHMIKEKSSERYIKSYNS